MKKAKKNKKIRLLVPNYELMHLITQSAAVLANSEHINGDYLELAAMSIVEGFIEKYLFAAKFGKSAILSLSVAQAAVVAHYGLLILGGKNSNEVALFVAELEHNRIASTWTMIQ